jgi:hypothetical protein
MEVKFTQECLVRLIYKETSATETLHLFKAMDTNPELLADYERLMEAYLYLPKVKFSVSPSTKRKVMAYSEQGTLV